MDFPTEGLCDTREWDYAIQAIVDAKFRTQARVAVVATLHESLPEKIQDKLIKEGIAPMLGLEECFFAISESAKFATRQESIDQIAPIDCSPINLKDATNLSEYEGKQILKELGISVVDGHEVFSSNFAEAKRIANELSYPIVAKASSTNIVHKSDAGGVFLNIQSDSELFSALNRLSDRVLIEKMASPPYLELLVGLRQDPLFGHIMVIGAGGLLVEVLEDTVILFAPFCENDFYRAFRSAESWSNIEGIPSSLW